MLDTIKKNLIPLVTVGIIATGSLIFASVPCNESKIAPAITSQKNRADYKSDEIVRCHKTGIFQNTQYGLRIEIKSIEKIDKGIEIIARAWQGQTQIGFGKDGTVEWERFYVINPPILVDDPNGGIVRIRKDSLTGEIKERRLREDHKVSLQDSLAHTIHVSAKVSDHIVLNSVGHTTTTCYPDPNPESTSVDGLVTRGAVTESWATIRAGAGTSADDSDAEIEALIFASATTNKWDTFKAAIATFDCSAIPDTDTIDSATLSFSGSGVNNSNFSQSIYVTDSSPDTATAVVAADYTDHTTVMATKVSNTAVTIASWPEDNTYKDFPLNAGGLALVSKTGTSNFGYRVSGEFDNVEPTWASGGICRAKSNSADVAGTSVDPKLVVVSSVPVVIARPPSDESNLFE